MSTSKEALKKILESITEKDIEREFNNFSKEPDKVGKQLQTVTSKMSEKEIDEGVRKYGGVEQFLQALMLYLAFKATLIRKGVTVGVAAGAGAALVFGAGSLCHGVACATGVAAINDIGDGMDMVGDFALSVADFGFEVAEESADFFADLIDGVISFFSS
ncbi:MAG: hypothetical protein ACRER2_14475 [Methylococcales bacterium]